jgi:hypothetical protein
MLKYVANMLSNPMIALPIIISYNFQEKLLVYLNIIKKIPVSELYFQI